MDLKGRRDSRLASVTANEGVESRRRGIQRFPRCVSLVASRRDFFRLMILQFNFILSLLKDDLKKISTNCALYPIAPDEKLELTLSALDGDLTSFSCIHRRLWRLNVLNLGLRSGGGKEKKPEERLKSVMKFLENEVEVKERTKLSVKTPPKGTIAANPDKSKGWLEIMGTPCDWQILKQKISERGEHLLDTSQWSDCKFIVGTEPHQKIFGGHKLFLAMSSPVFEAMFYGGMAEKNDPISILDVQPDAFKALLEYIYTDSINLQSFDQACELCYVAKKYMLPHLVKECTDYLWRDLFPKNACRAYEFAKLFEEPSLMEKCLQAQFSPMKTRDRLLGPFNRYSIKCIPELGRARRIVLSLDTPCGPTARVRAILLSATLKNSQLL
uniref:BTB domain-containing protein n=1 Tax=Timema douglasi TaxID=61478 RepID=A0A7R8Z9A7_TIMDO|nr:unnamed protein product [Timema douglasi]